MSWKRKQFDKDDVGRKPMDPERRRRKNKQKKLKQELEARKFFRENFRS
jgi:hypothetical protein